MAAAKSDSEDVIGTKIVEPLAAFVSEGRDFVTKCSKPNFQEMREISTVVGVGFLIMGVIGFFVKLFSMPLNQILMS
jgi:protein transport protein SEC61 subunit gamma and related proteins